MLYRTPDVSPPGNTNTLGRNGNSGDHNPLPPTTGELPPTSRIVFASPRPIDNPNPKLPAATAIFSAEAPDFPLPVAGPGLPWAADRSNSGGPGEHGIGVGKEYGAGDTSGNGAGVGNDFGHYGAVVSYVSCKYCPDPQYSDEARKAKLQGHVTLRVLVGTDGRAKDVQIVQRLGMGLDENSLEAIRHWQFLPARDAAHRPVASWITIETVFRLF